MGVRFVMVLLLSGCGGAAVSSPSQSSSTTAPLALEGSGRTPEDPVLACHVGPERSDYAYIASYVCPDGTMPLLGNPDRGAMARLGNIGEGANGHIIDEYEVPCRPTPVRIYVDAYHCAEGVDAEPDGRDLTAEELQRLARDARAIESMPFDERAARFRDGIVEFLRGTDQVHLLVCPQLWERIATDEYRFAELVRSQFVASLGAGVIETSDAAEHQLRNNVLAVEGVLRLYGAMLEEAGQVAAFGPLDELMQAAGADRLPEVVESILAECEPPPTVMQMQTNGQNVWPPTGPECERLVRCCESNGLVHNGGAVSGQEGAMLCLLGAVAGCGPAVQDLATRPGISCPP